MRVVAVVIALAVLCFCIFGFMATFEPLPEKTQLVGRIVYGVLGAACVVMAVAALRPRK